MLQADLTYQGKDFKLCSYHYVNSEHNGCVGPRAKCSQGPSQ